MNYYYLTDVSEVAGPYPLTELEQLLSTGAIQPNTQVCAEGYEVWQPLSGALSATSEKRLLPTSSAVVTAKGDQGTAQPRAPKNRRHSPVIFALATLILLFCVAAFILWQRGMLSPRNDGEIDRLRGEVARLKAIQASIPATPKPPSPTPKLPLLSEESKTRIANFVEKASKLRAMTEQGVRLEDFKAQLSEVRGTWDSITTVGLPQQFHAETQLLQTTVSAWELAQEIWSEESDARAESLKTPGADMLFTLSAGSLYRTKLSQIQDGLLAASVPPPKLPDFADSGAFEIEIVKQFNAMTDLVADRIEQSRHSYEIDILNRRFQDVITKFNQNLPEGFTNSFAYNDLRGIPDLITDIGIQRKSVLGGGN